METKELANWMPLTPIKKPRSKINRRSALSISTGIAQQNLSHAATIHRNFFIPPPTDDKLSSTIVQDGQNNNEVSSKPTAGKKRQRNEQQKDLTKKHRPKIMGSSIRKVSPMTPATPQKTPSKIKHVRKKNKLATESETHDTGRTSYPTTAKRALKFVLKNQEEGSSSNMNKLESGVESVNLQVKHAQDFGSGCNASIEELQLKEKPVEVYRAVGRCLHQIRKLGSNFVTFRKRRVTCNRFSKARLRRLLPNKMAQKIDGCFNCVLSLCFPPNIIRRPRTSMKTKQHQTKPLNSPDASTFDANTEGGIEHKLEMVVPEKVSRKKKKRGRPAKRTVSRIQFDALDEGEQLEYIIERLESLTIHYPAQDIKAVIPRVDIDSETLRMSNLLLSDSSNDGGELDEERQKWWEQERTRYGQLARKFIQRMDDFQANRKFSRWKGSVTDSVMGAFLTQNCQDHISSSAFISLAARFPPRSTNNEGIQVDDKQESVRKDQGCSPQKDEPVAQEVKDLAVILATPGEDKITCAAGPPLDSKQPDPSPVEKEGTPKKFKVGKAKEAPIDWEAKRIAYSTPGGERSTYTMDAINWDAVRRANVEEVAAAIQKRGQHNVLARDMKAALNRLMGLHGSTNLEWLRNLPPDDAKKYLLEIKGLGLKSVECIRLLSLHHPAFPVDTNVGRVAVRLGWVPLEPLPEEIQLHLLNNFPLLDKVQQFLWPRLCELPKGTLYELHYHLITFGKVFCTKKNPKCNVCPMRGDCKHFASAIESARLALPAPCNSRMATSTAASPDRRSIPAGCQFLEFHKLYQTCEPIVESPPSPIPEANVSAELMLEDNKMVISELTSPDRMSSPAAGYQSLGFQPQCQICKPTGDFSPPPKPEAVACCQLLEFQHQCLADKPIVEFPPSPKIEPVLEDIEDFFNDEPYEIQVTAHETIQVHSKALVAVDLWTATIPKPPLLKAVKRLSTEHQVYVLDDDHPLLVNFERRDRDDTSPYLVAIWPFDETNDASGGESKHAESVDENSIRGTILLPCRTATRGFFPLNGTYFQVNEVFADDESSKCPINIPSEWIWNCPRRTLYCGTSVTGICTSLLEEQIKQCFLEGFICLRGFNRQTRQPTELDPMFNAPPAIRKKEVKTKKPKEPKNKKGQW